MSLIDLSPESSGLLIPVFRGEGSNLPFVQEMDESFFVVTMLPYMEVESYDTSLDVSDKTTDVGEQGIIAFRSFDQKVHTSTIKEIFEFRDQFRSELELDPFLDLQLGRICGDRLSVMFDRWNKVLPLFSSPDAGKRWVTGENRLFQRNSHIWGQIKSDTNPVHEGEEPVFSSGHSFEYYFRWLNKNKSRIGWQAVWLRAFHINPFEERLIQLGSNWLRSQLNSDVAAVEFRSVLYVVLERTGGRRADEDVRRGITGYLLENPDQLFGLLYPSDFVGYLIASLHYDEAENTAFDVVRNIDRKVGADERYSAFIKLGLVRAERYESYLEYLSLKEQELRLAGVASDR